MKVAFFKGDTYGNFLDESICWWTSSNYSHVAIVIGDTWYTSSPSKGVHVYKEPECYSHKWDFVEVELDTFDVTCRAEALLGAKYDFMGLFGFVLRPAEGVSNRWFCSEFVAHCLGMQDAWRYDPATLYSSLTYCKK